MNKATTTSIIRNLNRVEADVIAAWVGGPKVWRRERAHAYNVFQNLSAACGGGLNPYLWTEQEDSTKLTHNNVQTLWWQIVIYMSAHTSSGIANLCPFATPKCIEGCLGHTSGRMSMDNSQLAQYVRTRLMVDHPYEFAILFIDGARKKAAKAAARGELCVARPNGTSDVPFERAAWMLEMAMADDGPVGVAVSQLQDYTKWPVERRETAPWYYLAKSISERHSYDEIGPTNVVVVDAMDDEPLPTVWNGMPVTDGDYDHGDLRFLDPPTHVTLLRKKGDVLRYVKGAEDSFVKEVAVSVRVG